MPTLDNEVRENIILDVLAIFMRHDLEVKEAQEISAEAIETLHITKGGDIPNGEKGYLPLCG